MTDTFPRQQARTKNFSLGVPRSFSISPDGRRVAFLRSKGGSDPVTCLWVLDLPDGQVRAAPGSERLVADPAAIGGKQDEPAQERARRERSRESASGIVAYSTDADLTMAAFAIAGQVYTTTLLPGGDRPHLTDARSPAIDPRPDPSGRLVGYVCDGALRVIDLLAGTDRELIGPQDAEIAEAGDVAYGVAEFVAAEEMGRMRGYWWAPDGSAVLVARVDNSPVRRWHIADPAHPDRPPVRVSYPAAGTPNAIVGLLVVYLDGRKVAVRWEDDAFPYLTAVCWDPGEPLIAVQSRDQRRTRLLAVDAGTGATSVLREDSDACWVDIVPGVPARLADGRIVWTADADGARRLIVGSERDLVAGRAAPVTPSGLQVRAVLSADGDTVLLSAADGEPTEVSVWAYGPGGLSRVSGDRTVRPDGTVRADGITPAAALHGAAGQRGVHGGAHAGTITVLSSRSMTGPGLTITVLRDAPAGSRVPVATIGSLAEQPAVKAMRVDLLRGGPRQIRTALLLPSWHRPGTGTLPVLVDSYGGPHMQRVRAAADAYLISQWLADQGFAVIVADGAGTPGRGPQWEREVAGDLAGPVLADQVDALAAAAEHCAGRHGAELDLTKVAIRGWSFGGFLAALAVLRRPDVFHAAVAGAPVTDWRLYDTHYTERYLGDPAHNAGAYQRSSLLADAHRLSRPLLIIHGLADDNVVVAHTLRLSSALLGAGRPHSVLPLSGVTHMASAEEVAENLLLLQVAFLRDALGVAGTRPV